MMSSTQRMAVPVAWGWKTSWVATARFWGKVPVFAPGLVKAVVSRLREICVQVVVALKVACHQT